MIKYPRKGVFIMPKPRKKDALIDEMIRAYARCESPSTVYAPGSLATADDCALVEELFSVVGTIVRVGEDMISPVTALSGSGPAYFCLLTEKLAEAAEDFGMDKKTADALALSTLIGTAKLLSDGDVTPEELRRRVTSKKGTTEAGVDAMLASGFAKAVADGFNAARIRSDELSKG